MAYLINALGNLTIKNGKIVAPDRGIYIKDGNLTLENVQMNCKARCIGAYNTCTVNIDSACRLETVGNDDVAILLYSEDGRTEAVTTLNLNGHVKSAKLWTISGNGTKNRGTTRININDGAQVKSNGDSAIYHPQGGTLTVNGGTVEGKDGIYIKSGNCIIKGGKVIGNGSAESVYEYCGDGTKTPLGHGIVMEFTDYPAGIATLKVEGGNIESDVKEPIGYYVSPKCPEQNLTVLKASYVEL